MVLVLTFSVQGIADALTFQTRTSGDLITVSPNQEFTITFPGIHNQGNRGYRRPDTRQASQSETDIAADTHTRTRPGGSEDAVI